MQWSLELPDKSLKLVCSSNNDSYLLRPWYIYLQTSLLKSVCGDSRRAQYFLMWELLIFFSANWCAAERVHPPAAQPLHEESDRNYVRK